MLRILFLAPADSPESASRPIDALAARLAQGLDLNLRREKSFLGMVRAIRRRPYDQLHAFGVLPLLAAALTFKGPLHFSPPHTLTSSQIRLLRAISHYRPFNAAFTSGLQADHWIASGFSDKTLRVIPPGVDFSACTRNRALRQSLGLKPDDIAVASIAPQGHRDALWATAILHQLNPHWVLLHRAQPSDPLLNFAAQIAGPSLLRPIPPSTPFESLLSVADFALSTSRDFTPLWPIVQSMAFGLPIVGWATRSNSEYLEHRSNALLVNPGQIAELARRLLDLSQNPSLQYKLADNARKSAYERCSLSTHLQAYRDLYAGKNCS